MTASPATAPRSTSTSRLAASAIRSVDGLNPAFDPTGRRLHFVPCADNLASDYLITQDRSTISAMSSRDQIVQIDEEHFGPISGGQATPWSRSSTTSPTIRTTTARRRPTRPATSPPSSSPTTT